MTRDDLQRLSDAGLLTGTVEDAARVLERGPKPEDLEIRGSVAAWCLAKGGHIKFSCSSYDFSDLPAIRDWLESVIAWHSGKKTQKKLKAEEIAARLVTTGKGRCLGGHSHAETVHVAGRHVFESGSSTEVINAARELSVAIRGALREMGVAE